MPASQEAVIDIAADGTITMIYDDRFAAMMQEGSAKTTRASHVEPGTVAGLSCWFADLAPVSGPVLGPFGLRADALKAEVAWLNAHRI